MSEIENYILKFPENTQLILQKIRSNILTEVPNINEKISYGILGFYLHEKPLVYFGGYKNHIGFYATPNGHEKFAKEFSNYKQGKGSVQFPLNQDIPFQLIIEIVKFRKQEILR